MSGALTLRVIPDTFRSILLDDEADFSAQRTWDLSLGQTAPDPRSRPAALAISHSAERVANAIVLGTSSPTDLRTLNAWGQHVGVSRGALRVWCTAAGAPARSCLDFLRVLRAVLLPAHEPWDLLSILDVVDQRSLTQLLDRGRVRDMRQHKPSIGDYLARQRFIRDDRLIHAVTRRLHGRL